MAKFTSHNYLREPLSIKGLPLTARGRFYRPASKWLVKSKCHGPRPSWTRQVTCLMADFLPVLMRTLRPPIVRRGVNSR